MTTEPSQYLFTGSYRSWAELALFAQQLPAECDICHGLGEYEGEYGPKPCMPCVVGTYILKQPNGKLVYVLENDLVTRASDGSFQIASRI